MKRYSQTVLTNMCMVCDEDYILVEDKQHGSYRGVTFPGGHIEVGELCASDEGQVRWVRKEEFLKEKRAHGMDKVFEIIEGDTFSECFFDIETRTENMK